MLTILGVRETQFVYINSNMAWKISGDVSGNGISISLLGVCSANNALKMADLADKIQRWA